MLELISCYMCSGYIINNVLRAQKGDATIF